MVPKYYGVFNIFIMPGLYTNANKSFVRNISYDGFINVKDNLLQTFRQKLNDPDLNLNRLYEFKCSRTTTVAIQKKDFALPNFKFKVKFSNRTAKDEVKKIFDSADNILIKPDKEAVIDDLKEELFGQGEKTKKLSKVVQLKSLTLAYENFFLYDLGNMITETCVTELNQNF